MVLNTLFIESLSNFAHGLSSAFFIYFGLNLAFFRGTNRPLQVLGYLFCLWGVLNVKDLLLYVDSVSESYYYSTLLLSFDMWAVPFCALFLLEILYPGFFSLKRVVQFELPLVLLTAGFATTGASAFYVGSVIYMALFCLVVVLFIVSKVRNYNRFMRENYSYTERVNVRWLINSMIILALCLLLWLYTCTHISHLGDLVYYTTSTLLWSVVLYYSLRQEWIPDVPQNAPAPEAEALEPLRNGSSPMSQKLEEYIREKELFLNAKLSLNDLATEMGTNRSYLSNCLNNELGVTFYDFINSFRLERAKSLLGDAAFGGSIEETALLSGFNSVSTFRRSFQKKYGCTPSQYRRQRGD